MGEVKICNKCCQLIDDVVYNEGILYLFGKESKLGVKLDDIKVVLDDNSHINTVQSNTWVYVYDSEVVSVCADKLFNYHSDVYEEKCNKKSALEGYKDPSKSQQFVINEVTLSGFFNSVSVIIKDTKDPIFRLVSLSSYTTTLRASKVYIFTSEVHNALCNTLYMMY